MKAPTQSWIALAVALLVVAWGALSAFSQRSASSTPVEPTKTSSKGTVQEITLPEYSSDPAPGPNLQMYQNKCLLCHSNRYVEMQPRFPRVVWEKEVKKMIDIYGASISGGEQQEIVEYLVSVRGSSESK